MTTSTRLSAVIMAHPARASFVDELHTKLDGDLDVVWDTQNNRWDTGSRAMLAYDPAATHHLVLQDDAVIPYDLLAGVEQAITHTPPNGVLGLYMGKSRPNRVAVQRLATRAHQTQASWIVMSQLHWGVGVVVPTHLIKSMVRWGNRRSDIVNYDKRMSRWFQRERIPVYYPWPSLVDHRRSPSLVPGRTSTGRHAHGFIGIRSSATTFDGTRTVVHALPPALVRRYRNKPEHS